jgi:hypothetical protein
MMNSETEETLLTLAQQLAEEVRLESDTEQPLDAYTLSYRVTSKVAEAAGQLLTEVALATALRTKLRVAQHPNYPLEDDEDLNPAKQLQWNINTFSDPTYGTVGGLLHDALFGAHCLMCGEYIGLGGDCERDHSDDTIS